MDATWYVEHRNGRTRRMPCDDPRRFAERAERLAHVGERGEVLLVEAASGLVLARRALPGTVPTARSGAGTSDAPAA